ncbi:hypothetical protein KFZ70_08590 [Tamlana fucoidanivorans]|uniref:Porin family protein n=1 Tax=Allotamlana fucoidanivorans TaxID=2583814 RepID=A0A5C4SPJ3_9FLAO|nr:hypothetical protein [Tamlana fucoidanivorans]TNJ46182.1 hypothetical protein FGF67_04090 [Tamlana fucoidanivorans]
MKRIMLFFILLCILNSYAQSEYENETEEKELKNEVIFEFGFTHIPKAFEEGKLEESLFVPTIGVGYYREITATWSLGMVLDLELADYLVPFGREDLERDRAFILAVLAGYSFAKNWNIIAGPAIEFEKNKNLFVLRGGLEYGIELGSNWGVLTSFVYDFKEEYGTWGLNIGVSRKF